MTGHLVGALGGGFIGAVTGAVAACLFLVVMKLLGKPIGKQTIPPSERPQTVPVPPTWKTETKRVLLGVVWFFVIWFVFRVIIGAIVGGIAGSQAGSQAPPGPGHKEAVFYASQAAAFQFFGHYGLLVALGSFLTALLGTALGFLPGTKRPSVVISSTNPSTEGHWPPPPTGAA